MALNEPEFTIGIEEEYLLVDQESRDLCSDPPSEFITACEKKMQGRVAREFLRCQLEVGTPVCATISDARNQLQSLRGMIIEEADRYGLAMIAASTHPFAHWQSQKNTNKERYNELADDYQDVVRRLLICGMHIHVGIPDDALRIDLHNQLIYFLPHMLALTTSSPFWQGRFSGLKSYRLSVFDELPRTGLPETFDSAGEYERTVDVLVEAGVIEDATKIWWDLRPSAKFPTLEMRISDVCTLIEDALCVAALFRCLARMLWRLRRDNQRWRTYQRFLIAENRWLAQRYGASGNLIDFGRGACVPYADLVEEILLLIDEDCDALDCRKEVERVRFIASGGTSADRQLALHKAVLEESGDEKRALHAVVDHLIAETRQGCS